VLLIDHDAQALAATTAAIRETQPGAEIDYLSADVTQSEDAARAVSHAVTKFGALNILVNNAAIRNLNQIETANLDDWEKVIDVNLLGAVRFCREAVGELRKDGCGSIVIVSSCYATMGRAGFGAYDASKAALVSLMRTLAWEEAPHGTRVNAVCPGGTLTPFTIGRAKQRGKTEADLRAEPKPDSLMQRWAEASEIAFPILFLASHEASFITGAALNVDAGLNIM
jgi:meso-butanediol dehydrogenase/(S,S)-butanediol dehydrogenase/diacetyl reductase